MVEVEEDEEEGDDDDEIEEEIEQVDLDEVKEGMEGALERLQTHFNSLRIGRATPSLLDNVFVEQNGERKPLKHYGQITVKDPQNLLVMTFDPNQLKHVMISIQNANLGFNPLIEKNAIKVPIPK